ncbi:mRNA transport regulator 3 [Leucosporidium creatinivorum]|uniref:mRNA transport regulator 3 n=1 Tax=Leucosporidium creatinivorum TaxID=106004 RepID=A0A1Y2D912_9BASI|nr:mRNA transport regulator 3 [Leucosporidium creatinivorum]
MQQADRRRFGAPEGAVPLRFASTSSSAKPSSSSSRLDGRAPEQVRPIFLQTGLVGEASGSAYIETGRTKLICAVYGPKPTPPSAPFNAKARLNVEVKFAPFSSGVRRFTPGKDTESASLSATLQQSLLPSLILEALPKSQIDLFLTILESDGSDADISAGVTAASVALAEAGVQMYGLVVGCCAAFVPSSPLPLLDPTRAEAKTATAFASLACMPALGTITNVGVSGVVSVEQLDETLQKVVQACGQIHGVAKGALEVESA